MLSSTEIFLIFLAIVVIITVSLLVVYRLNPVKFMIATVVGSILSSIFTSSAGSASRSGGSDAVDFDKVEVIDTISSGVFGTVYRVKYEGKYYALKRQKVMNEDEPPIIKTHSLVQSLDCASSFIKILGWRIYKCDFVNKPPASTVNMIENDKFLKEQLLALNKSEYCLDILMELGGHELQKYTNDDIAAPKPISEKYNIVNQLLKVVQCARRENILLGDFHFANILLTNGDIKIIDYDEIRSATDIAAMPDKDRAAQLTEMYNCNDDLFNIIMGCMRAGYIFEKYLSHLKEWPSPRLMVERLRASGKWAEVEKYLGIVFQNSSLKDNINSADDKKLSEIGKYIDFIWGIVDPDGADRFWREYIPEFESVPNFILDADLRYILDNYWDLDRLIKHFSAVDI